MPHEELPFWNFNIPASERTAECPDFLLHVSDKDRKYIGQWDSDYQSQSWDQVRDLISSNRIDEFRRSPSDLRRYRHFIDQITRDHGSVIEFMLRKRLSWTALTASGPPFEQSSDIKILQNDWPYGVDARIVHLVVWTKFRLEDDPSTGDLTPESKTSVDGYVSRTFRSRVEPDRVLWFRNWTSLKSVHAIEHFHVMLFDPPVDFVREITGGDTPMCEILE